jgi:hypothetical protein
MTRTEAAPARISTREHSSTVEPVVNEDEVSFFHARNVAHEEGPAQVFHSLGAIEFCLRGGVAGALQRVQDGDAAALRDERGKLGGLVEFAFAKTDVVQRHGHECVERARGDARIVERVREPVGKRTEEVALAVVFEVVDEIADDPMAAECGDGALEMHVAIRAVRAGERLRDRAIKRLRAAFAKRRHDVPHSFRATGAEVDAGPGRRLARRAVRRKAKRAERTENSTRGCRDAHGRGRRGRARR